MNHDDLITGAELQTLREACDLTREDFADMAGVQARTVKHWENGRAGVPGDVADLMRRVDASVSLACHEALYQVRDGAALSGRLPAELVLLRYNAEEAARYRIADTLASLGRLDGAQAAALQGAIINRARLALPWLIGYERCAVRVVWMQAAVYEAWRGAQGLADSETARAAWAVGQVAAQAKPHRADQPPGA